MYVYVFGKPNGRVLSVVDGDIGLASEPLDPFTHPVISQWAKALSELSGLQEMFEDCEDRTPLEPQPHLVSKIALEPAEKWTPASFSVRKRASLSRKKKTIKRPRNDDNPMHEQTESEMGQTSTDNDISMASGNGSVGIKPVRISEISVDDINEIEVAP